MSTGIIVEDVIVQEVVSSYSSSSSWDNCVVFDLNGLCIPMRHEGIFYAFMVLIGLIQLVGLCRRLMAREMNYLPDYSFDNITEWHLTFGRMGLLCLSLGILLDNFRLFLGSFDSSWPDYILYASNTSSANELWGNDSHRYSYRDIGAQRFLWCYSSFMETLFAPFILYSATYIVYKQRQWRRVVEEEEEILSTDRRKSWFLATSAIVVVVFIIFLVQFALGPIQHGFRLVKVTGIWSITTNNGYTNSMLLAITLWLSIMILLAIVLLLPTKPQLRKFALLQWILVNGVAMITRILAEKRDDSYWLPAVSQVFIQWAIALHRKWDGAHNPDDFGRLSNEELREALLPMLLFDTTTNHNNDNEEGIMDQLRQPLLLSSDSDDSSIVDSTGQEDMNDDEEEQSSQTTTLDNNHQIHESSNSRGLVVLVRRT